MQREEETKADSIVEEVRRIKEELAARFDFDVARILADAREKDKQDADRLVSPPARRNASK